MPIDGTFIVIFLLVHYAIYTIKILFSKKFRKQTQDANQNLDKLREVKIKTLEEQKKFIDNKYPPFEWHFDKKHIPKTILIIAGYFILFRYVYKLFIYFGIYFSFTRAIIIMITFPLLFNYIVKRFGIQKSDISYMLKFK